MGYVDCFVAPVRREDLPGYLEIARQVLLLDRRNEAIDVPHFRDILPAAGGSPTSDRNYRP